MTIRSVGAGTRQNFTDEEIEALRRDESSSAVLNEARHRTGDKGRDVAVRGDGDVGLKQQLAKNKDFDLVGEGFAVADGVGMASAVGAPVISTLTGVAGGALEVLLPVASFAASQYGLASMQATKTDTRDAATRDVMRGAMLLSLELPSGYVDGAMPRDVGTAGRSPARKICDQIKSTPLAATLQLHCDQASAQRRTSWPPREDEGAVLRRPAQARRTLRQGPCVQSGLRRPGLGERQLPFGLRADARQLPRARCSLRHRQRPGERMSAYRENAKPPSDETVPDFRPKGSRWALPIVLFYIFGPSLVGLVVRGTIWWPAPAFVRPGMMAIGVGAMVVHAARTFLAVRRARRAAAGAEPVCSAEEE